MNSSTASFHNSSFITHHSARLAYIIYTSGTSGKPKGVLVEHRNIAGLMTVGQKLLDYGSHDVWTLYHSFGFDFSVWEMYGALLHDGQAFTVGTRRCGR